MDNEEIEKMIAERQVAIRKQETEKPMSTSTIAVANNSCVLSSESVIENQKMKDLQEITHNENFIKLSKEINERDVASKLHENSNKVLGGELQNQYDEYFLKKKKQALDFKIKKEKNVISQQIKAEIKQEKQRIAETRFGYLYEECGTYKYYEKLNDGSSVEKTAIKYKNFTPSYSINRLKEFQNWYKNQTETVQKVIWTSVKFVLFGGLATGVIFIFVRVLKWLASSGALGAVLGN